MLCFGLQVFIKIYHLYFLHNCPVNIFPFIRCEEGSTAQTSEFRKADFSLLKELVDGILRRPLQRIKEFRKAGIHLRKTSSKTVDTQENQNV